MKNKAEMFDNLLELSNKNFSLKLFLYKKIKKMKFTLWINITMSIMAN